MAMMRDIDVWEENAPVFLSIGLQSRGEERGKNRGQVLGGGGQRPHRPFFFHGKQKGGGSEVRS